MPALGDEFRAAREARGLSLSDVAEHIHIRATYLEAIEEEDWSAIGAPVYIRGFLRTYARFLGIDPEHAVEVFNQADVAALPPTTQYGTPQIGVDTPSRGGPSIWVWIAGAVAAALVLYVGYGYYQLKVNPAAPPTTGPVASVPVPVATATAAAAATAASTPTAAPAPPRRSVGIRLSQVSWLRVTVDGNVILEGEFPPGTVRDFYGKHVHMLVGNAGGVEVTPPGGTAKVLGAPGEVVERDYVLERKSTQ
jgi:cytoskeleton protein RodZ